VREILRFVWLYFKNSPWYVWVLRIGAAVLLFKLWTYMQSIKPH